ncbi:hypothetical protein [Luteibacter sp. 3190]|uniref:hypothetical protein n=1 Tax=Luteibacter sp. 3190 TaxID=2817736 RepID=UPI002854D2C0|nr:hypothetical protein [Luteibacter sp. 3190]MDR6935514.1 hypothetical protein [Luteibacter sp. 3190]
MTSVRGIAFDYRPSVALTRLGAGIVFLASVSPLFTGLPGVLRCFVSVGIAFVGWRQLAAWRRPPVTALAWAADGVWSVTLPAGSGREAELRHARVFGRAVFLDLRWDGGAAQVALLPDNAPAEELRLLRARLA